MLYIMAALFFFVVAGIMAAVIRAQLAFPNGKVVPPEIFNRCSPCTAPPWCSSSECRSWPAWRTTCAADDWRARHGVPASQRLRLLDFPLGGILLYFSYIAGEGLAGHGSAPDVGWFAYAPLTSKAFSRGSSTDYWTLSILLAGIGSIASAINVIATVFSMRTKA
jgi:cytochrome c oxidase subunit 1